MSYLATEATLRIKSEDLLRCIWYEDGSGGLGAEVWAGLDSTPNEWFVNEMRLTGSGNHVIIKLRRKAQVGDE